MRTSENTPSRHSGEEGPLVSFFTGFCCGAPYLLRIDVAAEAGYHLTIWPAQEMMHGSPTKSRR